MSEIENSAALEQRVAKHNDWLVSDGERGEKADFSGASLSGAELLGEILDQAILVEANLEDANLHGASLRSADLRRANLKAANLDRVDFQDADLGGAELHRAVLRDAQLENANLERAWLIRTYLVGANLRRANLRGANLLGADLRDADMTGCDLRDAYLSGTNLSGAILTDAKLDGVEARNVDAASKKSLEGAKSWNKGLRARVVTRAVAAAVVVLLLIGGAISYTEDLRSLRDARRIAEKIVATLSALATGDEGTEPRPTVAPGNPSPPPPPVAAVATAQPFARAPALQDAAGATADAAKEAERAARRRAEDDAGKAAAVAAEAERKAVQVARLKAEESARKAADAAAETKRRAEQVARLQADERARKTAAITAEKQKAVSAVRAHGKERAIIQGRIDSLQLALRDARVREERARETGAAAEAVLRAGEASIRQGAAAAAALPADLEAARRMADEARSRGKRAVLRDDAVAWRTAEDEVEHALENIARLEAKESALQAAQKVVRGEVEAARQRVSVAAVALKAEEAEARRLTEDVTRLQVQIDALLRSERIAERLATVDVIDNWYVVGQNANVRAGPLADTKRIGYLKKGAKIRATGKVASANWYRVTFDDNSVGYVFGTSLDIIDKPGSKTRD